MAKRETPLIAAEVLGRWRDQAAALQHGLQEHPLDSWAWVWRVRVEVIRYLLRRYAGEDLPSPPQPPEAGSSLSPEPYAPLHVTGVPSVPAGMGKPPRISKDIRSSLDRLAEVNRPRTEQLERERQAYAALLEHQRQRREEFEQWLTKYTTEEVVTRLEQPQIQQAKPAELCADEAMEDAEKRGVMLRILWNRLVEECDEIRPEDLEKLFAAINEKALIAMASSQVGEEEILKILMGKGG